MPLKILDSKFDPSANAVVYSKDCLEMLNELPSNSMQLIITSPPYNIGKEYEKRTRLEDYVAFQDKVVEQCWRVLKPEGNICWQVGNHVDNGSVVPLDVVLFPVFLKHNLIPRNRIVWHFEHGLHCTNRFSGRYETIIWFSKSNNYHFDVDPVRVPQKYPGKKYFKGPKAGQYSCNPKGKNPGDVWVFPNVKNNHVEKTEHPCQFPVELVERLVLTMTKQGDWVLDPFAGSGTSIITALLHNRRGIGAEVVEKYITIINERITAYEEGTLKYRCRTTPVYDSAAAGNSLTTAPWLLAENSEPSVAPKTKLTQATAFEAPSGIAYGK